MGKTNKMLPVLLRASERSVLERVRAYLSTPSEYSRHAPRADEAPSRSLKPYISVTACLIRQFMSVGHSSGASSRAHVHAPLVDLENS